MSVAVLRRCRRAAAAACLVLACAVAPSSAATLTPEAFPIARHVLPNGLVVLTHEDHTVPSITLWQWYRVGSRNELPGITGISHFLEHMMFNGSSHVAPREFDARLESHGGSSNAFTDRDYTSYYKDIGADQLDVLLQLDADRMAGLSLLPEQIAREREIVKEERRSRTENDVDGQLDEALWHAAFRVAPVGQPVLGSMADIDRLTRDDLATYFAAHYGPDDCVLVLTGDFDTADALQHITTAFGALAARGAARESVAVEPPQTAERRVRIAYPGDAATVVLGYRVPGARHPDAAALEMLAAILGGGSASRLPQALVRERGVALEADARYEAHLDETLFQISAGLADGVSAARGIAAIDSVVARLAHDGPTTREMHTAAAQLSLGLVQSLTTNNAAGEQIGFAEIVRGDFRHLYEAMPRWAAVSGDAVRRAARRYLVPAQRTIAELVPGTRR